MIKTVQGIPYDYEVGERFSPVYNRTITQSTCIIPGGGCVYYRAKKGDVCPFCAFPPFSRYVIKGPGYEDFYGQWTLGADIYQEMYLKSLENTGTFDKLAIFNGGSFFPRSELPRDFQHFIYQDVASRPEISQLMVEAYPSFISEKITSEAMEMLGSTDFMVGIGFESKNDFVRNKLLKKRIGRELFEKKVRLLQNLGVQVFVYAFLKAPQLDERQALDETLSTIKYLNNLGVDEIALSCAFVPPGTYLEEMYRSDVFRPPWLWTILEIIETAQKYEWPVSVGGFEDSPPPVAGPHNCPNCDPEVNKLLDHYRLHGHLTKKSQVACNCHSTWHSEMKNSGSSPC